MKKFTKAQRKQFYLEAAQNMDKEMACYFICTTLLAVSKTSKEWRRSPLDETEFVLSLFPEFAIFKPKRRSKYLGFWPTHFKQPRVMTLLLCAAMCK